VKLAGWKLAMPCFFFDFSWCSPSSPLASAAVSSSRLALEAIHPMHLQKQLHTQWATIAH